MKKMQVEHLQDIKISVSTALTENKSENEQFIIFCYVRESLRFVTRKGIFKWLLRFRSK